VFAAASVLSVASVAQAQTISYGTNGVAYTQNFDGLGNTTATIAVGGSTVESLSNGALFSGATSSLDGWFAEKIGGTGASFQYRPDDGSGNAGAIYNYRTSGSTNFALGSIASGTVISQFGAVFTNNTGGTVTSITISFTGEQWRLGGSANIVNTLTFGYSVGANTIDSSGGTFVADTNLNYADTIHGATATVLDGTNSANQVQITDTITGLNWTSGSTLAIRWADANDSGNDDGLAIDNFSFTAFGTGAGSVAQYWNPNGATGIGGNGTWDGSSNVWNPKADASGTLTTYSATTNTVFGGTAGTVSVVSGGVTANGGVEFAVGGYIINGPGVLTLGSAAGGHAIAVDNAADTATINAQVSGANGLQKNGPGTLALGSTANNFTGGVQIAGGTISISDDRQLGDSTNDVTFSGGGTLKTSVSMTTARNFSGNGSLNIANGTTLTVNGNFGTTALTLSNNGTLDLEGATSNVGVLAFSAPGTLTSSGNIVNATGLDATNLVGKATVLLSPTEGLNLGSGTLTVNVGTGGDLALNTPVALGGSGNSSLKKTGTGTLELLGDNADVGFFRLQIGSAGTANGGTVSINNPQALGINQLFFNFGTLQATTDLTGANAITSGSAAGSTPLGVSLGGLDSASTVFAGSNMEFDGPSDIFQSATAHSRITVNNTTILGGVFTVAGTGAAGNALTVDGTGTLVMNGDASAMTLPTTVTASATLAVNNAWAGAVTVNSTTAKLHVGLSGNIAGATTIQSGTLYGTGTLAAVTIGDGVGTKDAVLAPGEISSVGTLKVSALTLNSDAVLSLKLDTTAHTSDLVTVTGLFTLTGSPTLSLSDIDPNGAPLANGLQFAFVQYGSFGGGVFVDSNGNPLAEGAAFTFGANQFQITYDGGASGNQIVLSVVPEPSAFASLAWGVAALAGLGRFRRRF